MNEWGKAAVRTGVVVALAVVGVWITEHITGVREWERVQARIAAAGETLEFPTQPLPIADEEELAAAPGVRPVLKQRPDLLKSRPADYAAAFDTLIAAAKTHQPGKTSPVVIKRPLHRMPAIVCFFEQHPLTDWQCAALEASKEASRSGDAARSLDLMRIVWWVNECRASPTRTVETVQLGIARHAWTEKLLDDLRTHAASARIAPRTLAFYRCAAADGNAYCERFVRDRAAGLQEWHGGIIGTDLWQRALGYLAPPGLLRHNQARSASRYIEDIVIPLRDGGLLGWYRHERVRPPLTRAEMIRDEFVSITLLSTATTARRCLEDDVTNRQTVIACALERHFLRSGRYPVALAELEADSGEKLPNDLNEQPMGYEATPDGAKYRLWSVGPDFDLAPAGKVGAVWEWKVPW